ncbi:MAG TPA: hypothetical protein VFZ42_11415 [Chitinophagaceae bacterium]
MKPIISLLLSLVAFSACNHQYDSPLQGTWKLTEVYDKSTGLSSSPPESGSKAIILTLSASTYHGNTFVNAFNGESYETTGSDGITFWSLNTTKVAEDTWGTAFYSVLSACMLQSVLPCQPSRYQIDGRTLTIKSPLRYDIKLRRL